MQVNLSHEQIKTICEALKSAEQTLQYNLSVGSRNLCGTMDENKQRNTEKKLKEVQEALKAIKESM